MRVESLVVDDVIAGSATLLACASRAMSRVEVDQIPAPCVGAITRDPYSGLTAHQ